MILAQNWPRTAKSSWHCAFKLYSNSLVYHRNILGSSSQIFDSLRTSSETFGNFRKMFGNVRLAFGTILENLRKFSESDRKSSENHKKRRHQYIYIIKRTLHGGEKIWILCSSGENNEWAQRTSEILFLPREHKVHIFELTCNVLFII